MDIRQQKYIIALAERGSLSLAAKELGVSQPALSTWLNRIEEELGTPLVIRSKRQLSLTPAGRIYLENARRMVLIKEAMLRDIRELEGTQQKVIRFGGTPNGGARTFAHLYGKIKDLYPTVKLQFVECYNEEMLELIQKEKIDIGVGTASSLSSVNCQYICTGERENILMIPEGYPGYYDPSEIKKGDPFPTADFEILRGLPFIMPSPEMSYYRALTDYFRNIHYEPNVIFQSANVSIIYNMLTSGNGIAVLPDHYFNPLVHIAPYSLNPKLIGYNAIFYPKNKQLNEAEKTLIDINLRMRGR